MGRPREHGSNTAEALVDAAEQIAESAGLDALTVRRVAEQAGTSTRAVYSLFGSKEGLVVALGERAHELLQAWLAALPETDDPAADLVEAGVTVFRRFVVEHPSLFRIAIQRALPDPSLAEGFMGAARASMAELTARVQRLEAAGGLGGRSAREAVWEFHALCEGLAALELRSTLAPREHERIWRDALAALVRGFAAVPV